MSLHFLAKMKIMVVKDIERDDIEFYSRILGCRPIASIDHFVPEALGSADLVEQIPTGGDEKIIQVKYFYILRFLLHRRLDSYFLRHGIREKSNYVFIY